jgi:hypothetical protein
VDSVLVLSALTLLPLRLSGECIGTDIDRRDAEGAEIAQREQFLSGTLLTSALVFTISPKAGQGVEMKYSKVIILVLALLAPQVSMAQTTYRAERAWKPFFTSVRLAVKQRNKDALMKTMSNDFYYLSSGGDENDNHDTRDEAFAYWETSAGGWDALEKVLAQGAVPNVAMREPGNRLPSRVAPPLANNRRAISDRSFEWYAVFEFRNNRWFFTGFTECCE